MDQIMTEDKKTIKPEGKVRYKFQEFRAKKEVEDDRSYSLSDIAEATGVNVNTLVKINRNKKPYPNIVTLIKLCDFFECDISEFIESV